MSVPSLIPPLYRVPTSSALTARPSAALTARPSSPLAAGATSATRVAATRVSTCASTPTSTRRTTSARKTAHSRAAAEQVRAVARGSCVVPRVAPLASHGECFTSHGTCLTRCISLTAYLVHRLRATRSRSGGLRPYASCAPSNWWQRDAARGTALVAARGLAGSIAARSLARARRRKACRCHRGRTSPSRPRGSGAKGVTGAREAGDESAASVVRAGAPSNRCS